MTVETPTPTNADETAGDAQAASTKRRSQDRLLVVFLTIAVIAAGILVAPRILSVVRPHLYTGTVFQESALAPPLDGLVDADGNRVDLSAYDGNVLLVFFGYTNCPDVCPGTLGRASLAVAELGVDADRVDLLLVGVDPARDSADDLEAYVDLFDPRFRAATGDTAELAAVASRYGVYYAPNAEPDENGNYLVDHTASLVGIGPDGSLRVLWAPDVEVEALTADLEALLG
ncbi:MAG: SCO family protein [Acidimicrobiales bacterium]